LLAVACSGQAESGKEESAFVLYFYAVFGDNPGEAAVPQKEISWGRAQAGFLQAGFCLSCQPIIRVNVEQRN